MELANTLFWLKCEIVFSLVTARTDLFCETIDVKRENGSHFAGEEVVTFFHTFAEGEYSVLEVAWDQQFIGF